MGKIEPAPGNGVPHVAREFPTVKVLLGACLVVLLWIGYRQATAPPEGHPAPGWMLRKKPPQIIYVVEKPTAAPQAKPPDPPPPDPSPDEAVVAPAKNERSAVQEFSAKPISVDYSQLDKPAAKKDTRSEAQRYYDTVEHCLSFSAEKEDNGRISYPPSVVVNVFARNQCALALPGGQIWVTVYALGDRGGIAAFEIGRFQDTIPPQGEASTKMTLMADPLVVRGYSVRLKYANL